MSDFIALVELQVPAAVPAASAEPGLVPGWLVVRSVKTYTD